MAGSPDIKIVSRAESLADPDPPPLSQPLSLINPGSLSMLYRRRESRQSVKVDLYKIFLVKKAITQCSRDL